MEEKNNSVEQSNNGIVLYKHNKVAYEKVENMFETENRVAVVHPTGSGKSFISLKWLYDNRNKRCLFLAPTYPICDQIVRHIQAEGLSMDDFPNLQLGIYPNFASVTDQYLEEHHYDCMVLDEFHRCGAKEWGRGIDRILSHNPNLKVLGVSATPIRYLDDNRNMAEELFYGNVASEISLAEAVAKGILPVPTYISAIYSFQEDLDKIESKISRLSDSEGKSKLLEQLTEAKQKLEKADGLPEIFAKHLTQLNGKYIVFCKDVKHMEQMMQESREWFKEINPNIEMYSVSSYQSNESNQSTIDTFEKSQNDSLKLLFSVEMLNEGLHVSDISGVIMLRPTMSPIIYMQQLGRALSVGHNSSPVVFDIVNNVRCHDAIKDFYEDVKKIIKKPKEFTSSDGTIKKDTDIDESVLERFRIFDEAKEFADILEEINGSYNGYIQELRDKRQAEQEFKDWLNSLSNEDLYNYYAGNEEVIKQRKLLNEEFYKGTIKVPLIGNITTRFHQTSSIDKQTISPQEFNTVAELLLMGYKLYDEEVKNAIFEIYKKNNENITAEQLEEKYRALFQSSKLIETLELEYEKAKLLHDKTNEDIYNLICNSEDIKVVLDDIKNQFEKGNIKFPTGRGLANILRGTFFANVMATEDFTEITDLLISGANIYDEKIEIKFKELAKKYYSTITESEFKQKYDAILRSHNIISNVAQEKLKANLIMNKSFAELYNVVLNHETVVQGKKEVQDNWSNGQYSRPVIGAISTAFRMVSSFDKETILTVEFNEISEMLINGSNLYDDDIHNKLKEIYLKSFNTMTEEMFEQKYLSMVTSQYLISKIETEKEKIRILEGKTSEDIYNHLANVDSLKEQKEQVSNDLKKGIFPTRNIAKITNLLSGWSAINRVYIPDAKFMEIRDKLLSGIPLYSEEIKSMLHKVYKDVFLDISEEKFNEKYKNYLTNYSLVEIVELEKYKNQILDNLDYKELYDIVKDNLDISSEIQQIDEDFAKGIIPLQTARPVNQAFRTGIFAEITDMILDGANLYDPDIRKKMLEILEEQDFASSSKTPEEKYIGLLKKEKLVRVIEIEKYKKQILDGLSDKEMYETVKGTIDFTDQQEEISTVKPVKSVIAHALQAVCKPKKLKCSGKSLGDISERIMCGANLYDEDIKGEYISIVMEALQFSEKEALQRYRDKLSNPVVVKAIEVEKKKYETAVHQRSAKR